MLTRFRNLALLLGAFVVFAGLASAQTSGVEGIVKGADGQPVKGAVVKFDRTDIKGHYEVKTDKKGHYGHYGLPLGTYDITVEIDGKMADKLNKVRTQLGDPITENFDLKASQQQSQELAHAAATGTLSKDQERSMSAEQKAAFEKQNKEREATIAKNKALGDAYNAGKAAMDAKNYDDAIANFEKAIAVDANQAVIYSQLASAYEANAAAKPAEAQAMRDKEFEAWKKAVELAPTEAAYYNNYALALGKAKQIPEMQANIEKAAQIDPSNAGKYYYNLGAVLMNSGQNDPACAAFKKAIDTDANYADAQYQYGVCMVSKASIGKDGKVVPPPGTIEAFQKYLQLKPDGVNAEAAKAMLASMTGAVSTKYVNPNAKPTSK
ncbi:carboxypeptidase regulatory-like domain-containing protein [Nevskia soli]|jgi:tetratricopeptide (TPR) repeat protein|uniref:carboxypeptidase regulatory-like domain-containing protein n=1 Tax=Nevskia soli TaxID=418856 RepID=UPI0015D7EA16|nr:carboxypeptidase regulatory-like domain-containing protein [Nevskia soli]